MCEGLTKATQIIAVVEAGQLVGSRDKYHQACYGMVDGTLVALPRGAHIGRHSFKCLSITYYIDNMVSIILSRRP